MLAEFGAPPRGPRAVGAPDRPRTCWRSATAAAGRGSGSSSPGPVAPPTCRGCWPPSLPTGHRRPGGVGTLNGLDSLLVDRPDATGVPVATVAVNGARNAACWRSGSWPSDDKPPAPWLRSKPIWPTRRGSRTRRGHQPTGGDETEGLEGTTHRTRRPSGMSEPTLTERLGLPGRRPAPHRQRR